MKSTTFALICATAIVSSAEVDEKAYLSQIDARLAADWPFAVPFPPMGKWIALGQGPRGGHIVATGRDGRWVAGGVGPKKAQWLAAGSRRRSDDDDDDHGDDTARAVKDATMTKQKLHAPVAPHKPTKKETEPTVV
ncbi:unnamed protein product [Aphanomyces euteiches]|uniref:Uncharacterized protein n=1 Tax=Aphanomyces euteiches TaxID=100861 RepID=A0A6G0WEM8_9STRA|nr:hypothetical protein Ae201684_015653 [Aphanomyces euteiches]KAH9093966.1 hypothetical protein Ae201684P_016585 [Aphanomyces euteiches]KAH9141442.1 hypothetical protein AeRB84_014384 [Aphanomyces euteiches]